MNLKRLGGEHTVDMDLLPMAPTVLDVGCRGFAFDWELLSTHPLAVIFAYDPDPSIKDPLEPRIRFENKAVTHLGGTVTWQGEGDGSYITKRSEDDPGFRWNVCDESKAANVSSVTVPDIMKQYAIRHWDLVKLDCEGSEFGILESWPGPIAKQLSVEFHDCMGKERWHDAYFSKLFAGTLKDYRIVQHEQTPLGPASTMSYWDSLLVLR